MVKKKKEARERDDSKLFAFLATFLSIIGFVLAIIARRDDEYVMHYAKQSLIIFICSLIVGAASMILFLIPLLGNIIIAVANILVFILWLLSWIYALSGKRQEVPVVGDYARKINL